MRIRGSRLSSRACDDVVGTAAVLSALDDLVRRKVDAQVTVFLTRAEEAGLVGALAACRHRTLPAGSLIVAIETSKAQPTAGLGSGVVVRTGDSALSFDPSLSAHVAAVAGRLARRDRRFRWTRRLMPGGRCESSAYLAFGYAATGLCLPLANYHNQGRAGKIAPERVDLDDFASLVKLLVALAAEKTRPRDTDAAMKKRLLHDLAVRGKYL